MNKWTFIFIGWTLGWNGYSVSLWAFDHTYKDGQIDALSGEVKYELVKQKDGSSTWERIKND